MEDNLMRRKLYTRSCRIVLPSSNPRILQNVGIELQPLPPEANKLAAEFEKEKRADTELLDVLNIQRHQMDQMVIKAR